MVESVEQGGNECVSKITIYKGKERKRVQRNDKKGNIFLFAEVFLECVYSWFGDCFRIPKQGLAAKNAYQRMIRRTCFWGIWQKSLILMLDSQFFL